MSVKRVYHPKLNAWQDVPEKDADNWKKAGWRMTKPDHVDDSDAPAVGEHPGFASVPVLRDNSRTVTPSPAAQVKASASASTPPA